MNRFVAGLVGLLLIVGVRSQEDSRQCRSSDGRTRCNVGLCFQKSDNAVNTDTNANIAKAILRGAYSIDAPCEGNFGCAFYGETIGANDVCTMWPRDATRNNKNRCVNNVLAAQTNSPKTGNFLEVCLRRFNSDKAFFAYPKRGLCRLTGGIIADRDIANPDEAEKQAADLKKKGVYIVCFLVGNTQVPYDPAYNRICDKLFQASDFPELWRGVEEMYGQLECCKDPLPTPPPTPGTTRAPVPPGECDNCKIVNGVGYVADPQRCDCWKRCLFKDDGTVIAITNCCQCGMFWDQRLLTCLPSGDLNCPTDQCKNGGTSYAYPGNCRAYWICTDGKSTDARCCPVGEGYDSSTQSCVTNANCNDPCPCDLQTTTRVCPFQPNPLDSHTYFVPEHDGSAPTLMTCPPGTDFNETTCKCSVFIDVTRPPCPVDFDLRCTENPLIDHGNDAFITNFDVTVDPPNGVCSFTPDARLLVSRFANYDWRDRFAIYSNFNGEDNTNNNAPLLSNTDCDEPSSVELRLVRNNANDPEIEAYIKTDIGTYTARLPYRPAQQNEAYMYYNGENLRLCVKYADGSVDSRIVEAKGFVEKCRCALQIGYGWPNRYYTGRIFDTRIYINCIPENFCP